MNFDRLSRLLTESGAGRRINLFYGRSYTSGQHAFGQNEKDVPAKDPLSSLEIRPVYNPTPELVEFFKKRIKTVTLQRDIWGTFHERSVTACATTVIDVPDSEWEEWKEKLDDAENLDVIANHITDGREIEIPFFSMQQVEDELNDYLFSYKFKDAAKTGESREEYWSRMIERYKAGA